jgi:hypothetical protein
MLDYIGMCTCFCAEKSRVKKSVGAYPDDKGSQMSTLAGNLPKAYYRMLKPTSSLSSTPWAQDMGAGYLCQPRSARPPVEHLCACDMRQSTLAAGSRSFTSALIWALEELIAMS